MLTTLELAMNLGPRCAVLLISTRPKDWRWEQLWANETDALIASLRQAGCYVDHRDDAGDIPAALSQVGTSIRPVLVIMAPAATPERIHIRAMNPLDPDDVEQYQQLVRPALDDSDYITPEELLAGLSGRVVLSWFAEFNGKVVGWASVSSPSRYTDDAERPSVHLMGAVVHPSWRGLGIGRKLLDYRIMLAGAATLTVSIRPGNVQSESLVASRGFAPGERAKCWRTWHRLPVVAT